MKTFISETLSQIITKHTTLQDVVIIVPSQRAGVYIKKECSHQIDIGFLPLVYSIEEFVEEVSGCKKIDTISLLFYFYEVYKKLETAPHTFDVFSSWALTALQDFNEADLYLTNTKDLFAYIRDIERLQKWSVQETLKETPMMKAHYAFIEKLGVYYKHLTQSLMDKKQGYQGLLFRKAVELLEGYLQKNSGKFFYFIGFNALSTSEEALIKGVLQNANADIFWDIDAAFLKSNHPAGTFIRNYQKRWNYYQTNSLKTVSHQFHQSKKIEVVGATKNITLIKEVSSILATLDNYQDTAVVLGDESLLPVLLNSIPKKVPSINITMGYSLKDMPVFQFIKQYFELHIVSNKLHKNKADFYYKPLLKFLNSSLIKTIFSKQEKEAITQLIESIVKNNLSFISTEMISQHFQNTSIQRLFQKKSSVNRFIATIIEFIEAIRDTVTALEKEYLYRFYTSFIQLQELNTQYAFFTELETLFTFFKQIIGQETLSFQGQPLQGLQCMGVLETRVLDFKNIVITSMNEGVIPKNSKQNSFIPFDVKVHFGLPTYQEKDAIFSYHIFRLFQRAQNIFLLYNTENDDYGNGEKSRFISQLSLLRDDVTFSTVSPHVPKTQKQTLEVKKTKAIIDILKVRAQKGFSPSAIGSYLYNPISLYKQKVLGLDQKEEVEETLADNTMGSILHKTLESLYKPYLKKELTIHHINAMEKEVVKMVELSFALYFKKGNFTTGKNKLIFEIILNYVFRFLQQEKKLISQGSSLQVLEVEKKLDAKFTDARLAFPIRFYGEIDRIDLLDGTLRIVDYKSGMVSTSNMKIPNDWELNNYKHSKALQVLFYAYLFTENYPNTYAEMSAGIFSFKNFKGGFLPVTFSDSKSQMHTITKERLLQFKKSIGSILVEIFDLSTSFIEKET